MKRIFLPRFKTFQVLVMTFLILVISGTGLSAQNTKIKMETKLGNIVYEIYTDEAPITSKNFIKYIEENLFDSLHFYRVVTMENQPNNDIKIEVIQGGLGSRSRGNSFGGIDHETTKMTGILHKDGVLSMARAKPGSASTEFFICIGEQPELDYGGQRNPDGQGFAAFGKVISGMNVVKQIQNLEANGQMLSTKVEIKSTTIVE